jgi:hypothetical protein
MSDLLEELTDSSQCVVVAKIMKRISVINEEFKSSTGFRFELRVEMHFLAEYGGRTFHGNFGNHLPDCRA